MLQNIIEGACMEADTNPIAPIALDSLHAGSWYTNFTHATSFMINLKVITA